MWVILILRALQTRAGEYQLRRADRESSSPRQLCLSQENGFVFSDFVEKGDNGGVREDVLGLNHMRQEGWFLSFLFADEHAVFLSLLSTFSYLSFFFIRFAPLFVLPPNFLFNLSVPFPHTICLPIRLKLCCCAAFRALELKHYLHY